MTNIHSETLSRRAGEGRCEAPLMHLFPLEVRGWQR